MVRARGSLAVFQVAVVCVALLNGRGASAQQPRGQMAVAGTAPTTSALTIARFRATAEGYSQYSGLSDSLRVVIRDSTTWRRYWTAINQPFLPPPEMPRIDFSREIIVLASMGVRPSAGFAIQVEGARVDSARLVVSIRRVTPGAGCAVAAVITKPVDIVRLPAIAADVWFAERQEISDCGP